MRRRVKKKQEKAKCEIPSNRDNLALLSGETTPAEPWHANIYILWLQEERWKFSVWHLYIWRIHTDCKKTCKSCRTAYNAFRYQSAGENAPQALEFCWMQADSWRSVVISVVLSIIGAESLTSRLICVVCTEYLLLVATGTSFYLLTGSNYGHGTIAKGLTGWLNLCVRAVS